MQPYEGPAAASVSIATLARGGCLLSGHEKNMISVYVESSFWHSCFFFFVPTVTYEGTLRKHSTNFKNHPLSLSSASLHHIYTCYICQADKDAHRRGERRRGEERRDPYSK